MLKKGLYNFASYLESHTNTFIINNEQEHTIIQFVDQLIFEAVQQNISDIHLEPLEKNYRLRFRNDGLLEEIALLKTPLAERFILRFKLLASLNISEKRLPQDGHLSWIHQGHDIDIRVSICPTILGEKLVLRLLNLFRNNMNFEQLGLSNDQYALLQENLTLPKGLILVSGPTGSGKTFTLYTALSFVNQVSKNIFSVEDPVEIYLKGINQINIHPGIGLTFEHALRACLRQDPDIIMIGEIRDKETATIALQAAQTGHLVLASLHASNAQECFDRLNMLGVEKKQIYKTLSVIVSQRLVRKLCPYCKQPEETNTPYAYIATGCNLCCQGYAGRTGLFEVTSFKASYSFNLNHSIDNLWDVGFEKIKLGITSKEEVLRVLGKRS